MKKQPLKIAIRSKIESSQLTAEQIKRLNALQQQAPFVKKDQKPTQTLVMRFAWAAVIALVAINLFWLLPTYMTENNSQSRITASGKINLIAEEVVRNHLNRKPLEIENVEEQQVLAYFTQLDFRPVQSRYLADLSVQPVGGRYCSIQSKRAAFLSYQSPTDGRVHTVYQANYDPDIFPALPNIDHNETPLVTWASGIKVTLWTEKDILFAMTD